jgi:alkylation response protein AidB-like acyl-CoA dehydrogenase
MNFEDAPEEAEFRLRCRSFLDAHATPKPEVVDWSESHWAKPSTTDQEKLHVAQCREWQRTKYDNGWAGLTWPTEYGGQGLSSLHNGIFAEEEGRYDVATGSFAQSIGMAGPTIIDHGTDTQKSVYLDAMLTGEHIWCQLFSEPNAGSDLAGLRTTAVRDGDEFIVNGQKVWTSSAQHAEWGMLLVRTDLDAHKHRGLSYLLLDMSSPGIEIRPLVQITGAAHFNEVFLTDVRVPAENLLGDTNKGWGPILTTLANERQSIGGSSNIGIDDIIAMAKHFGVDTDPVVRQDIARLAAMYSTMTYMGYRVRTASSKGVPPGPESSVMKLAASRRLEFQGDLVMKIMGASALTSGSDAYMNGFWQNFGFLGQWAARIGGGTDQVQRNICGENVLGLPQEPRLDKGIPFRDIPS